MTYANPERQPDLQVTLRRRLRLSVIVSESVSSLPGALVTWLITLYSGNRFAGPLPLATLALLALHLTAEVRAAEMHPADTNCGDCHLAQGAIEPANAKVLVASQEELCSGCHQNALTASHPTGIKPSSSVPEVFPLDSKGNLTCSTCHRVHDDSPVKLRVQQAGRALCESCHAPEFFTRMKDGGSSVMHFGHLDARASLSGNMDNFSIQCMTCHELLTGDPQVSVNGRVMQHDGTQVSHPVGMRYADSVSFGGYRPVTGLQRAIQLPDGKVSCISCHQGYSERHGGLVVENVGDQLCFSCHAL
jgi:predicted CXXCH cytochrome family protein